MLLIPLGLAQPAPARPPFRSAHSGGSAQGWKEGSPALCKVGCGGARGGQAPGQLPGGGLCIRACSGIGGAVRGGTRAQVSHRWVVSSLSQWQDLLAPDQRAGDPQIMGL